MEFEEEGGILSNKLFMIETKSESLKSLENDDSKHRKDKSLTSQSSEELSLVSRIT
jgi:hypothetical protein